MNKIQIQLIMYIYQKSFFLYLPIVAEMEEMDSSEEVDS